MVPKNGLKLLTLAFSLVTTAISIAPPHSDSVTVARSNGVAKLTRNETNLVERVGNGGDCSMWFDPEWGGYGYTGFSLHMWGPWISDGGKGFQDNVKGQCDGFPLDWEWTSASDGSAYVEFQVDYIKPNCCVQNALWLASQPTGAIWGVECCWDTSNGCSGVSSC